MDRIPAPDRRRLLALLPAALGAGCLGPAEIADLAVRNLGSTERRMTLTAIDNHSDEVLFEEAFTVSAEGRRRFPDGLPPDASAVVTLRVADGPRTSILAEFIHDDHTGVLFTLDGDDLRAEVRESYT